MIKIVKGVYGYVDKHGFVRPKDCNSEPFNTSPEQEARLVKLGVAEYVDEPAKVPAVGESAQVHIPKNDEAVAHLDPDQLKELTNAELKKMAEEMGIDTAKLKTKAQLIEAITAVDVAPGPDEDGEGVEDDGEVPPTFDAAEAVE